MVCDFSVPALPCAVLAVQSCAILMPFRCLSACGEVRANLAYPRAGAETARVQPPRQSPDCRRGRPLRLSPSARRPLGLRARSSPPLHVLRAACGVSALFATAPPPWFPSAASHRRCGASGSVGDTLPSPSATPSPGSAASGRRMSLWPRSPSPPPLRARCTCPFLRCAFRAPYGSKGSALRLNSAENCLGIHFVDLFRMGNNHANRGDRPCETVVKWFFRGVCPQWSNPTHISSSAMKERSGRVRLRRHSPHTDRLTRKHTPSIYTRLRIRKSLATQ